jgi:hypothetical protein
MSSVDAMGPGTPTPITFNPRPVGSGQPLQYQPRAGEIAADVAKGGPGANLNAQFQPRPPTRPPGSKGIADKGSFVDSKA